MVRGDVSFHISFQPDDAQPAIRADCDTLHTLAYTEVPGSVLFIRQCFALI